MRKRTYNISMCVCPDCNNKFPIPRMSNKAREKGHQKNIWCPFCKVTKTMTEIREGDFV